MPAAPLAMELPRPAKKSAEQCRAVQAGGQAGGARTRQELVPDGLAVQRLDHRVCHAHVRVLAERVPLQQGCQGIGRSGGAVGQQLLEGAGGQQVRKTSGAVPLRG